MHKLKKSMEDLTESLWWSKVSRDACPPSEDLSSSTDLTLGAQFKVSLTSGPVLWVRF